MQAEGRPPGLNMYDSAAETGQSAQRSNSNGALVSDCPLLPSCDSSLDAGSATSLSQVWLARCCSCSWLTALPRVYAFTLHEHLLSFNMEGAETSACWQPAGKERERAGHARLRTAGHAGRGCQPAQ